MPYRVDLPRPPKAACERLVDLGALDVEPIAGGLAAILPDHVTPEAVAAAVGVDAIRALPAHGRDDGSVWVVSLRAVHAGRLQILPADSPPRPGTLRLTDGSAFGTGLHPTTALCLEALDDELRAAPPTSVLDIGTGSGVLALAALCSGVAHAVAVDLDAAAVRAASDNARLNGVSSRLHLVRGGPDALGATWPLVVANVLAAPLIEMAPAVAPRVGRGGRLILSGIRSSLAADVDRAYRRAGMRHVTTRSRDGWVAMVLHTSW